VSRRTIVIAGAGIGGLTAALALARKGFRIALIDKAEKLEATGAGIQLSPNAARVLLGLGAELGLGERLAAAAVAPEAVIVKTARNREIARLQLGASTQERYGAPYWIIHRGDLQAALLEAVRAHHDITLTLGATVDAFAVHARGITVQALRSFRGEDIRGSALIGADGLWSNVRALMGETDAPVFARRSAWRALVPAAAVAPEFRAPSIHLWLGHGSHLVHYPVKGGAMINIVAIAADRRPSAGWSTAVTADEVMARFSRWFWAPQARELLAVPAQWLKWPLYDRRPQQHAGRGPVTLLGDAAHPMLPFLAQGAAAAIEDAAVLADALAGMSDDAAAGDVAAALRRYETARRPRTTRIWRAARRNDAIYHLAWPASAVRNFAMGRIGSRRLLARYDWIYDWRPE
jgi:2-polyprenyl-6-methoxyphenol hydroxylase-like FAD-dependent oxidoreductase